MDHWVQGVLLGVLWKKRFLYLGTCEKCSRIKWIFFSAMCIENTQDGDSKGMGSFRMSLLNILSSLRVDFGQCHWTQWGGLFSPVPRIKSKSLAWPLKPY